MSSIVASVTGQRGGNSGGAGLNFNAEGANIQTPTTAAQAQEQYQQTQLALDQQQRFLASVQAQGGLGNQAQVYNQLQGVAAGTGPNPAQAQLAQATGANTANQAALMAGQRGAGANAGLIARQAAMQGGANQQQAAGQAATMQAQQSLNALGQMGQLATNQANQQANATSAVTNARQNQQQAVLNSIAQQNNSQVGMQSNVNSSNAGISAIAAQGQMQLMGNIMNGAGAAMMGAEGGEVPMAEGGSPLQTLIKLAPLALAAEGGQVSKYAHGGQAPDPGVTALQEQFGATTGQGPKSGFAKFLQNTPDMTGMTDTSKPAQGMAAAGQTIGKGMGIGLKSLMGAFKGDAAKESVPEELMANPEAAAMAAEGGRVPALLSPGEKYLDPKAVKKVEAGADPIEVGKKVPGKSKHPGNDYRNDTFRTELESGGIVLPKSVMESKKPHMEAKKFVAAIMARHGKLPKKSK